MKSGTASRRIDIEGCIYHKLIYAYFKERYSITLLKLSYHVKCNQSTPVIILTNDTLTPLNI